MSIIMFENTDRHGPVCSICLEDEFTNVCHSNICLHEFCFNCLRAWSDKYATCPLCKKSISTIYYKLPHVNFWATYDIATKETVILHDGSYTANGDENGTNNSNNHNVQNHSSEQTPTTREEVRIVHAIRMRIYRENLWAIPFPDIRDCRPETLRNNLQQLQNLREFVHREITIIGSIEGNVLPYSIEITENFVIQSALIHDLGNFRMLFYLFWPYLRTYTIPFCHELFAYASSPHNMIGYDRHVRYYVNGSLHTISGNQFVPVLTISNHNPIVISDSEDETIAIDDSTSDTSNDDATHDQALNPVENVDVSHRDQPSVSTGEENLLNKRYNLRRTINGPRRLSQTTSISQRTRQQLHMISSDEEGSSTRGTNAGKKLKTKYRNQ